MGQDSEAASLRLYGRPGPEPGSGVLITSVACPEAGERLLPNSTGSSVQRADRGLSSVQEGGQFVFVVKCLLRDLSASLSLLPLLFGSF